MSAGAVGAAPALCKVDGCGLPVKARRMCSKHYQRWLPANPDIRMDAMKRKWILAALPARTDQICEETGLEVQAVRRNLAKLKEEGLAFISGYDSPDVTGSKFMPVWSSGSGKNAVLTKRMRLEQRRKTQRKNRAKLGGMRAGWVGPLGIRA